MQRAWTDDAESVWESAWPSKFPSFPEPKQAGFHLTTSIQSELWGEAANTNTHTAYMYVQEYLLM